MRLINNILGIFIDDHILNRAIDQFRSCSFFKYVTCQVFAHNAEPSALSRIWLCMEYEAPCSCTLKMCNILLGSVNVSKDQDSISKIDLCSREDMCISSNLVSINLVVGKNHSQSASELSLQTLVHSCILTSKTDQDFSLYLSRIKCSILTKQTALPTT